MEKAESKYEELNENNEFTGKPKEDEVIVTLQSEMQMLRSTIEALSLIMSAKLLAHSRQRRH